MRIVSAALAFVSAGTLALAGTGMADASSKAAASGQDGVRPAACKSGHADAELWSPKGRNIGVYKSWKCDGHGGYNGTFYDWKADNGVWTQMRVHWESGRLEQKKMKFGKHYTYKGAYSVYLRACDSSGCAGWW
ncbi:hypothetical protein [Actinoallomurus acaciae]|uniref:Uncharacterized protein n=1 Tax=Actinoallomurus acaciae TaxID=502577 RepID=A0ABV5YLW7_9ACTN